MIEFDEYGSRLSHTVVLLGDGLLSDTFANQYGVLHNYHLIVPHIYGSGREAARDFDLQSCASAIAELVGKLGKPSVSIIGYSLGAELAVKIACEHSVLFDKVLALSPMFSPSNKKTSRVAALAVKLFRGIYGARLVLRTRAAKYGFSEAQTALLLDYFPRISSESIIKATIDRVSLDALSAYRTLEVPLVAVCGAREGRAARRALERLADRNERCKLYVIARAKRGYVLREPEKVNPLLLRFLTGQM